MKLKILLYIIYFVFSSSTVFSQTDGNNEFGKDQWDNWVEFNISDVKFTTDGTDRFFECTIRTKKLGDWYSFDTESGTKPPAFMTGAFTKKMANATVNFSYNPEVFDENGLVFTWSELWHFEYEGKFYTAYDKLSCELQEITGDKYLFWGWSGAAIMAPEISDSDFVVIGKLKWKLKPNATGKTGFKIRSIDEARGSAVNNEKTGIMGIERTGNGDTLIPNTNTPTKPILATGLDSLFCLADSQLEPSVYSIVGIPDAADTCIWSVAPADAAVITYVNDTAVSIQWNKVGEHTLSVIARNAVGDSDPAIMTIKIFEKPTATLEPYTYACEGSAVLTFSGLEPATTTYEWLKADKINKVLDVNAVTEEGEYHLALDNGGCVDTLTTEVKLNVKPEVIAERLQASCSNAVQLTAEAKNNVGTIRWYKDADCTQSLTDLNIRGSKGIPQYYWVRVETSSGCKSEVVKVTAEFGTMPTADIPPVLSQCAPRGQDSFVILPVVNLGNGITAKWYKEGNWRDEVTNADASGGVYALVLDNAGCTDTIYTNVEYARRPVANVLPVITACTAGEAVLSYSDLSAGTATWLGSNKQPLSNGTQNNIKVPVAGQYYLALKEATCTDTLSVWVEINEDVPNVLVPSVFTACTNKAHLKYEGGGNATLTWLDQSKKYLSSQNPYTLVTNSGVLEENYFLKMEGSGGCKDTIIPVTVKYNTKPEVTGLRTEVTSCNSVAVLSYSTVSGGRAGWSASSTGAIISEAKSCTVEKTTGKDTVTYYLRLIGNGTTACDDAIPVKVIFNSDRPKVSGLPSSLTACADKATLQYDWISDGTAKWLGPDQKVLSALNPYVVTKPAGSEDNVTYYLKIEGNGCDETVLPVEVQYNTIPGVIVHDQTACGSQHTLLAERTGGTLKWLRFDNTPIASPVITDGSGIQYYKVYADGGSCKSDTATFSVIYNTNPIVKVTDQTSCETEHRFIATTTDGELKWLDNTGASITNPVTGPLTGTVNYKVYADGGVAGCLSDTLDFTVTYGTRPVVTVQNQTSCDLTHVLTASTTAGELKWLNAAGTASVSRMVMVNESGEYIYKVYAEDKSCNSDTVSFTVSFGISPKVDVNDQTACGSTHTLYAKATGGTLLWYNAGNQLMPISPLVTGTNETKQYKVKAIEGACSSELADVSVIFGRKPVVTVEDQITCDVAYMPVASTTAGTLEWFNAEGQPIDLPLSGALGETNHYKVKAVDGDCESDMQAFSVTFGARPQVIVANQTSCNLGKYTLDAEAIGGNLVWLNAQNERIAADVSGTAGTINTYRVYTDGGMNCVSDTAEFTVSFGIYPVINIKDQTTCGVQIMPEVQTTAGELEWSDDLGQKVYLPLKGDAGKTLYYKVKAKDDYCESEPVTFSVTYGEHPTVNVSDQTTCTGDYTLVAEATGGNLKWLYNNTLISPVITGVTETRKYQVYADGGSAECMSDTLDFTVNYGTRPTVTVNDQTTCSDKSYLMTAEHSGGELVWLEANTSKIVNNPIVGASKDLHRYRVIAKDNNCVSDTASFSVAFRTRPQIEVEDQTSCSLNYTLRARTTGGSLVWLNKNGQRISANVKADANGVVTYKVFADGGSCQSDTVDFTVTFGVQPVVEVADQTTCATQSYTLVASTTGGQLEWFDAAGTTRLASNIVNAPVDGSNIAYYNVRAKDGECGESTMLPFSVTFGARPVVSVEDQTACKTEHTLVASATGGNLVWLKNNAPISPIITGGYGTQAYQVYADGGSAGCVSDTVDFTVTYGVPPIVNVRNQSICDTMLMLTAETTAGTLKWYTKDNNPVSNPVIGQMGKAVDYLVQAVDGDCKSDMMPFTVSFGSKPLVEVSNQTSCSPDYMLKAETSGGNLVWLDNTNKPISPVITGGHGTQTYKVYADGGSCKSDTVSFTVTYGVAPIVTVADQVTCATGVYSLQAATTGGKLQWYTANDTQLPSNIVRIPAGVTTEYYAVGAKDGGCVTEKIPFSVSYGTHPVVNVQDQTACGSEHAFIATTTGGNLKWLNDAGVAVTNPVTGGSGTVKYKVYADAGGSCQSDTVAFTVKYNTDPVVTVQDITTCDTIVMLAAETSAGTLKWYKDINTTQEITSPVHGALGTVGSYYVKAVDGACESDVKALTVNFGMKPVVTVSPQTSCDGNHILTAETTGGKLVFLKNGTPISPIIENHVLGGVSETYEVYADGGGTCKSDVVSFTVTFGVPPVVTVIDQSTCDESYRLMASTTGGQLEWFEADGTTSLASNIVNAPTDGTNVSYYKVGARDGECVSAIVPFSVTFNSKPHVTVLPQTSCAYTYTLKASASGGTLKWLKADKKTQIAQTVTAPETPGYSANYYVFADGGSCQSDTLPFTVTFGVAPTVVVEDQSTCDTMLLLKARTSGGELVWWNGDGTNKISNPVIGTIGEVGDYMVQSVDGTCVGEKIPFTVNFGVKPVVTVSPQTSCDGDHILTAETTDGNLVWMQNNAPISPIITGGTNTQAYQVYADGGDGCVSDTATFTVTYGVPPVVEVENGFACGKTYTLTAKTTDGTLKWYKDAAASNEITTPAVTGQIGETVQYYVRAVGGENCESELKPFTVTFGSQPQIIVAPQTSCAYTYTLQAQTTTGSTLKWLNAAKQQIAPTVTATQTVPGHIDTYYVYADGGGCKSDTVPFTVTYGVAPVVTVEDQTSCTTQNYTLVASTTGGQLEWFEADGTTPLSSNIVNAPVDGSKIAYYKVRAKDGECGESPMMPFSVAFGTRPVVNVQDQSSCNGDHTLTATTTGGKLMWLKDGVSTSPIIKDHVTGGAVDVYEVYATDGSCQSDTIAFRVTYGVDPIVTVKDITTCDTIVMLTAETSGGTLKWYKDANTIHEITSPLVHGARGTVGSYYVKAVDGACESNVKALTVNFGMKPVVTVAPQTSCDGNHTLTAETTDGTLVWLDKNGAHIAPEITGRPVNGSFETYQVYAEGSGCLSDTMSFTVTYGVHPVVTVADQSTCETSYKFIASTTGGSLVWLDKDANNQISGLVQNGTGTQYYNVKAVDGECESAVMPFSVTFGTRPVVNVQDQTSCAYTYTLQATTTSGGTLKWLDAAKQQIARTVTVIPQTPRIETYHVYVDGGSACVSDTATFTVAYGASPVVTVQDITTCDTIVMLAAETSAGTLKWYKDINTTQEITSPVHGALGTVNSYYVKAVDGACESDVKALTVNFGMKPVVTVAPQTSCDGNHTLTAETTDGNLVFLRSGVPVSPIIENHALDGSSDTYQVYADGGTCKSDTMSFTVTFGVPPVVTVVDQSTCDQSYRLMAETTGGKLEWFEADGTTPLTSNIVNAPADNSNVSYYKVGARDGECVSQPLPFSVTFNGKPHVTVVPQTSCAYTYTLKASASGGTLKWLKADKRTQIAQTVKAKQETAGYSENYYVFADGGSCQSDTLPFTVTFGVAPTVVVENQSTCDTMLLLKARTSGGELVWWNGDGTNKISNPVIGKIGEVVDYMVQAVDGTCVGEKLPFSVDFGVKPVVSVEDQTSCNGDHVLTAVIAGGSPVWMQNNAPISPIITGGTNTQTYQVYADGGDGCVSDTATFTVTYGVPPIVEVENGFACGETYTLTAKTTDGTLKWYKDAAASNEITTPAVTGQIGETVQYYVRAVGGENCESELKPFTVTFGAKPEVKVFDQTSCDRTHTLLANVVGGTPKWLAADGTSIQQTQTVTAAGKVTYQVYADGGTCQSDTLTFTVDYDADPLITVKSPQTVCGNTYKLDAVTTGGILKWYENDETTEVTNPVTVNSATTDVTYKLQAVDGTCKSDMMPFTVSFNTKPAVKVFDQTTCGTTLTLSAQATGGNLVWLNDRNEVIGKTVIGNKNTNANYKVYATGGESCISDTVTFNVAFGKEPYAVGLPKLITSCGTTDALLFFETLSDAKATYKWLDGSGREIAATNPYKVTKEGLYSLQVTGTEAGCATTTPVEVIFNQSPLAEGLPEVITSCTGEAELFFDNLTMVGATYEWYKSADGTGASIGNTNPLKVNVAGDYSLKITAAGCAVTVIPVQVKLNTPPIPLGLPEVVSTCGGTEAYLSFILSDRNATFAWSKGGVSFGNDNPLKVTEAGTYQLTIKGKGCANDVIKEVKVETGGSRPVANAGVDQTIKSGDNVQLFGTVTGGTAPYKYKWKPGASVSIDQDTIQAPLSVALTETTEFYLQVTDKAGCVSLSDTMEVTLTPDAFKVQATAAPQNICMKNTSQLNAVLPAGMDETGVTYSWTGDNLNNKAAKAPVFTPAAAGDYAFAVVVKKGNNTTLALTNVKVGSGEAPVLAMEMLTSCVNDTVWVENTNENITDPLNYKWYLNNVQSGTETYFVLPSGTHKLQVVANAGACASDTLTQSVEIGTRPSIKWITEPALEVTAGQLISGTAGIDVQGTAPYQYTWISPSALEAISDSTFEIRATGFRYSFEVYATDAKGCLSDTLLASTKVVSAGNLALQLEVIKDNNKICKEGVSLLKATIGKRTTAPYKFEWFKDGETTPLKTTVTNELVDQFIVAYDDFASASQKYYVQVSDSKADGQSTDSQETTLIKDGDHTAPKVVAGAEQTILSGASTVLLAEPSVAGTYEWFWSPVSMLMSEGEAGLQYPQTDVLTAAQEYQVYISDANCVSAPAITKVNVSADGYMLKATPDTVLCIGNTVLLKAKATGKNTASLTYEWKVGGALLSSKDTATYRATGDGNFVAVVTAKANGKIMAAARVNITVRDANAPVFDLITNVPSCQRDTLEIQYQAGAVQAVSYEWRVNGLLTTAKTDRYVLAGDPGTYKVEVVGYSADGCRSAIDSATLNVALSPEIISMGMVDSCGQSIVEVKTKDALNYTWEMIQGRGSVNSSNPKQYIVEGNDDPMKEEYFEVKVKVGNATCSVSQTFSGIVYSKPIMGEIDIQPSTPISAGDKITATALAERGESPYSFHWLEPGVREGISERVYEINPAKYASYIFEVYVVDANGCMSDTINNEVAVAGGTREVRLDSRYGKQICKGGAAILDVQALGFGKNFTLELYSGSTLIRTKACNTSRDTFWVFPSADINYKVVAKSLSGTDVAENTLALSMNNNNIAPVISAGPDMTVPMNGSTVLLSSAPEGVDVNWVWSPANKLATAADTSLPYPQTAKLQANQEYSLYAIDNQSCLSKPDRTMVYVDNINGFAVEITPENPEVCKSGLLSLHAEIMEGRVSDQVKFEWSPDYYLTSTDASNVVFTAPSSDGKYEKVVLVSDNGRNSAAKTSINVLNKQGFTLEWAQGRMACVGDTLRVIASATGLNYTWKVNGQEVSNGPDSIFVLGTTDQNNVEVFAKQTSGDACVSDVLTKELTVGKVPVVDILQSAFATAKDAVIDLNIVDAADLSGCGFVWSSKPEGMIATSEQGMAITKPLTKDVRYIYTASSPQSTDCQASDSVNVYLIPEAPAVTIKGNTGNTNIVLNWNRVEGADSYVVKYTENDPYNILGEGYKVAETVPQNDGSTIEWAETSIREMAFYQVMAQRNVAELGNEPILSAVTDTVGMTRHIFKVNNDPYTSYTRIAILFDISDRFPTTAELGNFLTTEKVLTFSVWDFDAQAWKPSTNRKNTWRNPIPLTPYSNIRIEAVKSFELVLYGKLSPQIISNYEKNSDERLSNYVDAYVKLDKPNIATLKDIGEALTNDNCKTVRKWNFVTQAWEKATYNKRNGWRGDYEVKIGDVFQIELNKATKW